MTTVENQPELAVITKHGPDYPLLQSAVAQLLEHGVYFDQGENQSLLSELPADLNRYKALLLDPPAVDAFTQNADHLARLQAYADHTNGGMVYSLDDPMPNREIRGLPANMLYDVYTSHTVLETIMHGKLTVNHPAHFAAMDARPLDDITDELRDTLLKRFSQAGTVGEFVLHNCKAAIALIEAGYDDLRQPMIDFVKSMSEQPCDTIHHDRLAGISAIAWYIDQTGDDAMLPDLVREINVMFDRRPRERGMLTGCGYQDDPLGLQGGPQDTRPLRQRMMSDSTMRRTAVWTETLHFHGPAFAALARLTGDRKYLDELMRFVDHLDQHHVQPDGLLAHTTVDGEPVAGAWARGQTHALLGLLYILEELDPSAPEFTKITALLDRVGDGLLKTQDDTTGLWRNLVDNPAARVESSGTTGIGSVYGRAILEGWLDRDKYEPMVRRALVGVKRLYWRGGLAAGCRGTGAGHVPSYYIARPQGYASIPQQGIAFAVMKQLGG